MKIIFTGKNDNIYGCFEHKHPSFEIVAVKNGDCITTAEKSTFKLEKNCILIIPPNTNHKTSSQAKFSDLFIQTDSLPFDIYKVTQINDYSGNLLRLTETIHSLRLQHYGDNIVNDLFLSLLNLVSLFLKDENGNKITSRLKYLIEKNFTNTNFSLANACINLGYNQDYLRRLLKTEFGFTPTEYLNKLRLNYAEKLICNTNFSIKNIALQCGYPDQYYFSRIFTKYFGLSPLNYRHSRT